MGGVTIEDKDEEKDAEKDVDENKDLMKNDSVQSLSYPHLPTPKLPTSVSLPMIPCTRKSKGRGNKIVVGTLRRNN